MTNEEHLFQLSQQIKLHAVSYYKAYLADAPPHYMLPFQVKDAEVFFSTIVTSYDSGETVSQLRKKNNLLDNNCSNFFRRMFGIYPTDLRDVLRLLHVDLFLFLNLGTKEQAFKSVCMGSYQSLVYTENKVAKKEELKSLKDYLFLEIARAKKI